MNILAMAASIIIKGVVPNPYESFVDYNVTSLEPVSRGITQSYSSLVSKLVSLIVFILVLFALVVLILASFATLTKFNISAIYLLCGIGVIAMLMFVVWLSVANIATESAIKEAPKFQKNFSNTLLYGFNSSIRDFIYLSLCK